MQTFKGTVALDFKAVVPQQILDAIRADAQSEDTTAFLKQCQARYPTDDDAFIAAVIKNGVRLHLRDALVETLRKGGMGGTVSPATIAVEDITPQLIEQGILPSTVRNQLAADIAEATVLPAQEGINAAHDEEVQL